MNRKEIIIAITALLVMIGGILFFMKALYPGSSDKGHRGGGAMRSTVVRAVPSDAVAFIVLDGTSRSAEVLADTTGLLGAFAGSSAVN